MPNMNTFAIIIAKFAIGFLYIFEYMRFKRAKRSDSTIEFKMDIRSWAETIVVLVVNIIFFVYPISTPMVPVLTFAGILLLAVTYFHTRRFVMIGKKVIFLLEHPFRLTDISRVTYDKGVMKFMIKNEAFKIRFPLGDMDAVMGRLSGKYFRKR